MKKPVSVAIALVAVLSAGFLVLRREKAHRPTAAEIAPPDAILFAHLPDLRRTAQRWPETALARLLNEPEVWAFLAQPWEKMPLLLRVREQLERLRRIGPREAFVAFVDGTGPAPKFVAGLSFSGSKSDVAALVAEPWAAWRKAWPAGRTEVLSRAAWQIETYRFEDQFMAGSFHAGWYFLANDLAALEQTLGRCKAGTGSGIGTNASLQHAAAKLPSELDAFVFAESGRILDLAGTALPARENRAVAAPGSPAAGPIAWGVKLEGAQIRDTIFIAGSEPAAVALTRRTDALTAPESLIYGAFVLPVRTDVPPASAPLLAALAAQSGFSLSSHPISWEKFSAAFGPECAWVVDWPATADAPSVAFIFAIRNPDLAMAVLESLTAASGRGAAWRRDEKGGVILYLAPTDGKGGTTPALAVTPQFVVLGPQSAGVRAVAARTGATGPKVVQTPAYQQIAGQVGAPTTGFAYLDLRGVFERSYAALRPFLGMSLALSPETGPYFDPAKLPSTEVIARHLGPSVYSQTARKDGTFIESAGTVSFSQTLAALSALSWSSAAPALRRLGNDEKRAAVSPESPKPEPALKTDENPRKPAEISKQIQNTAEKSHIRASQP